MDRRRFLHSAAACAGAASLSRITSAREAQQSVAGVSPLRARQNINRGWKFLLGDAPPASDPAFDDAGWLDINLPHSFSIPYFRSARFYVGYGWYRTRLNVSAHALRQQNFLEFEGVFQDAEVFVNGNAVGRHRGGYTGFSMNVGSALHEGDNVIAVRVNNNWNPQLAPRAGEHVFSGGIYRNVYLLTVSPLHVTWYGAFVKTLEVSASAARIAIDTEIRNAGSAPVRATVETTLFDPDRHRIEKLSSEISIAAGETATASQQSRRIAAPQLWDPDHPHLYSAVSQIFVESRLHDEYITPFGIRSIQWTAEQGFFLNGSHRYFHGADVHQDHAGWGDAVTNAAVERDVQMVKEAGFDFIRGSHYPHHPCFAEACDQMGILFWSENCFWGTGGFGKDGYWTASAYPVNPADQAPFEQSVRDSLRDMIRINRNHPSIIAWSMGNEVFFTDPSVWPKMRSFLAELVDYTHQLDPTRPAAVGGVQRGGIDKIGDVAGYNGDGARLFIDPGVPNAVTEYGAGPKKRPGTYDPHWGDIAGQPQFAWRGGQALWCAFDHGSIMGQEGLSGIVDYFRIPKRAWYWYRNAYRRIPPPQWPQPGQAAALQLTSIGGTTIRHADGTDDVRLLITVVDRQGTPISNSPPVTLTIESGPGEFPTGRSITFEEDADINISDGLAAIEFRCYYSGKTLIRATSPGLRDAVIEITSTGAPAYVEGRTPLFHPPAYVRFTGGPDDVNKLQNLSVNRPTRASSEQPGHTARYANDGAENTYWSAASGAEAAAWWEVELERNCNLRNVSFALPFSGAVKYSLQVPSVQAPANQDQWRTVLAQQETIVAMQRVSKEFPRGTTGKAVRFVFESVPEGTVPSIAEVVISGTISEP